MVENRESESQKLAMNHSAPPESSDKPDALEIIKAENSIEDGEHTGKESAPEMPSHAAQIPTVDGTGSSIAIQGNTGQTGDQTIVSRSTDPLTSMSDEEFQKAKDEQKQKDEQEYQEWKSKLQQIQKCEHQPQSADPGTDEDEEYYQGYGQ